MKEFLFVLIALSVAGGALAVFFVVRNIKINKVVMSSSVKISRLLQLNDTTNFHDLEKNFDVYKHYDNKSHFNKIEPAYIMAAEIKNNINSISNYATLIFENRTRYEQYKENVSKILCDDTPLDYSEIKVKETVFKKRENVLFIKNELKPVTDCSFVVNMSYSSPKGKVNLSKQGVYCFNDLYACLESISRSRLDRKTYENLALVERGDVSDSLRYDIMRRDDFKCVICGASASQGARLHVDHIVPIAKGGKSIPSNLRTLCERCNIGKSDKIEVVQPKESQANKNDDSLCGLCGAKLILREGKYGKFYGCSRYPDCKFTKKIQQTNSNNL